MLSEGWLFILRQVVLSRRGNLNWRVQVSFEINLHIKDISILHQIKYYFGVGNVTTLLRGARRKGI